MCERMVYGKAEEQLTELDCNIYNVLCGVSKSYLVRIYTIRMRRGIN